MFFLFVNYLALSYGMSTVFNRHIGYGQVRYRQDSDLMDKKIPVHNHDAQTIYLYN